jgi:hypothetical protein
MNSGDYGAYSEIALFLIEVLKWYLAEASIHNLQQLQRRRELGSGRIIIVG